MMKQVSDFKIFQDEGFTLAEFPYGQGNFVMDVILPESESGVSDLIQVLDYNSFKRWIDEMVERETDLSFPRFKYGFKKELKGILSDMGMGIAFTATSLALPFAW